MISVIVPIHNVDKYLNQCIDSIIGQTYHDLEIILIDDGSTDKSKDICDSYSDNRIRVYHTENRGLSAARNLGIDESHGELLYFLDGDDWIEEDFLEKAAIEIENANILCFSKYEGKYSGIGALNELINGKIGSAAWSKLFRRECFNSIRFPEGRIMEDIATTYKLLLHSKHVIFADIKGHHYRQRAGSITHTINTKNIIDYWIANKERFIYCESLLDDKTRINLLKACACAICRAWGRRNDAPRNDDPVWDEMACFAKTMFPYEIIKNFPMRLRLGLCLAKHNNNFSFWVANKASLLTRKKFDMQA